MTEADEKKAARRAAHLRQMAEEYDGTPQGQPVADALRWRAGELDRRVLTSQRKRFAK